MTILHNTAATYYTIGRWLPTEEDPDKLFLWTEKGPRKGRTEAYHYAEMVNALNPGAPSAFPVKVIISEVIEDC